MAITKHTKHISYLTFAVALFSAAAIAQDEAAPVAGAPDAAVEAVKEDAAAVVEAVAEAPAAVAPVVDPAPAAVEVVAEKEAEAEPEVVVVKAEEEQPVAEDAPAQNDNITGAEVSESSDPSKISLSLDAVDLPDVIRLFTRLSGANIICNATNLSGTVTANLNDVDWKAALTHILDTQGLVLKEKPAGSGIFVITQVEPGVTKMLTKSYKLDFIKAAEAKTVIEGILGLDKATVVAGKSNSAKTVAKKDSDAKDNTTFTVVENGRVVSYPAANKIVVTTTEEKIAEVEEVLKEIDVERPQVYIEAKIVQVSGDARRAIGIDWSFLDGYTLSAGPFTRNYTRTGTRGRGTTGAATANKAFFNDNYISSEGEYPESETSPWASVYRLKETAAEAGKTSVWTSDSTGRAQYHENAVTDVKTAIFDAPAMQVAISALETSDDVAQISNPRLVVANEEHAVIDMSTKDPYVKVDETVEGTGTETTRKYSVSMDKIPVDKEVPYIEGAFFSYGIRVDVTPRVNNSTNITVVIEPTLSDRIDYYTPGDGNTRFPTIASKSVKTTFSLGNGQTAVIGGLTTTRDREVEKKVPILGSIPILGYLFRHNVKEKEQVETIIFVTVGIIDSSRREEAMALPDGARLTQKRIDKDGKIIDKHVFESDEEKTERETREFLEKAKADGVLVPEAVED